MKLDVEQLTQLLAIVQDARNYANYMGGEFSIALEDELRAELTFTIEPGKRDWRTDKVLRPSEGRAHGVFINDGLTPLQVQDLEKP